MKHINLHKNTIRESVKDGSLTIHHIAGKLNCSDLFTKELKGTSPFCCPWTVSCWAILQFAWIAHYLMTQVAPPTWFFRNTIGPHLIVPLERDKQFLYASQPCWGGCSMSMLCPFWKILHFIQDSCTFQTQSCLLTLFSKQTETSYKMKLL